MICPFITSPHLPPHAVVFSVAVWACRIPGAPMAAAAAALPVLFKKLRRENFHVVVMWVSFWDSQSHIGTQANDTFEQQYARKRENDRDHRGGGDRSVEVEADVIEQHDRQGLTTRHHEEQRDRKLVERDDESEDRTPEHAPA